MFTTVEDSEMQNGPKIFHRLYGALVIALLWVWVLQHIMSGQLYYNAEQVVDV
jgi:hypothetical protein